MTTEKKCVTCGEVIRKPSPLFNTCPKHRTKEEQRAAWAAAKRKSDARPKPDSDDRVLERLEASSVKPPPAAKAKRTKAVAHAEIDAAGPTWMERFFKLHEALGLDAEAALEEHCRAWVELTTSRALARSKPAAKPNGVPPGPTLQQIAADYERAREQAEAAEP